MADGVSSTNFEEIQKQYIQMAQLKGFIWTEIEQKNLDLDAQRKVLNMTYFFTSNSKYAPSVSYQRLFLRQLLKLCEDNGSEIADELYEAYGDVFGKVEQRNEKCYKTYTLPSGALITLEETQQYISHGTTGLCTWMAGEYLAEWALENLSTFQQRSIIELGCGTGLTGLVICCSSLPSQYLFSDCHESVLEALQHNLSLNNFAPSQTETGQASLCGKGNTSGSGKRYLENHLEDFPAMKSDLSNLDITVESYNNRDNNQRTFYTHSKGAGCCICGKRSDFQNHCCVWNCKACNAYYSDSSVSNISRSGIDIIGHFSRTFVQSCQHLKEDCGHHSGEVQVAVCQLDWSTVRMADLEKFPVGIILAADVIYDIELIPHLVRTLHLLLSSSGDKAGRPVAYIASTIRNSMTYEFFLSQLSEHNITWGEMTKPSKQIFYYDRSCEIKITRLEV